LQFGHEKIVEVPPYGFVLGSGGVSHSHRDVVKLLLDSGADANAKTDLGLTPLHFATEHKELAVLLLKRGADVNTKENSGVTPLHCAAIGRRKTQERRRCTQRQQEATRKWWNCYLRLGPMSAPRIITV
jgi:ankyrin repeat protein